MVSQSQAQYWLLGVTHRCPHTVGHVGCMMTRAPANFNDNSDSFSNDDLHLQKQCTNQTEAKWRPNRVWQLLYHMVLHAKKRPDYSEESEIVLKNEELHSAAVKNTEIDDLLFTKYLRIYRKDCHDICTAVSSTSTQWLTTHLYTR